MRRKSAKFIKNSPETRPKFQNFRCPYNKADEDGMMVSVVSPYVMDLNSTNGTFLNEVGSARHRPPRHRHAFRTLLS